nr:FecR family protein [uncultured Dyadobacter sp.]
MDRQRLAFLLEKQQTGTCTADELAELAAWYDSFSPREWDIEMELELEPGTAARIGGEIRDALPGFPETDPVLSEPASPRIRPVRWMRMAAAVFLALLIAGGVWWQQRPSDNGYAVISTSDRLAKVVLPDSSAVWVKPGSTLRYVRDFEGKTREVYLNGEAFFDVSHDASRPFIVHTTDLKIRVLGTTFNVKSYPSDKTVEATLVRGKVMVEKNRLAESEAVILAPNERAVYSREARTMTVSLVGDVQEIRALDLSARERQNMIFEAAPFKEVLSRLESRFQVKIHIDNRQGLNCLFTADFEKESLAEILDLIALSHNVTYQIKGNEVFINGSICTNEVNPDPLMKH